MIYCGSSSAVGKVSFPVSDPDNICQFFNNKNLYKILPYQCLKRHRQKGWPLILDFLTFFVFYFFVGLGSKSGGRMHSSSGSAKAKKLWSRFHNTGANWCIANV
jgi:hypothetical protein